MIPSEAAELLSYAAATDNRKVTPEAAKAWSRQLAPFVTGEDAVAAIDEHFATRPDVYLGPGHLNEIVRRMRRQRVEAAGTAAEPAQLDGEPDDAWRVRLREQREAIASGRPLPYARAIESEGARPALALPSGMGRLSSVLGPVRADLAKRAAERAREERRPRELSATGITEPEPEPAGAEQEPETADA